MTDMNAMFKKAFPMPEAKSEASRVPAPKIGINTYKGRNEFQDIARYVFDKRRNLMQRLAK